MEKKSLLKDKDNNYRKRINDLIKKKILEPWKIYIIASLVGLPFDIINNLDINNLCDLISITREWKNI